MSLVSLKLKTGIIAGCIAATIMGATGLQAWVDHRDTIINTEATVDNMARVVEAHIQATLTQARTVTDLISEMVIEDEGPQLMREASRWKKLRSLCQGLTGCKSIAIVDPDGQVVALTDLNSAPHIDASDRAYFQMPRETDKLYIGAAMVTRIEGSPILFPIAMPVRDNDGKLLAIVTIGMNTGHLTDFYGLLGFGGSATVAVIKSNGELVARYPDMKQYVGRHLKDSTLFNEHLPKSSRGVFHARSALDGRPRIAAYTSIKAHDLVVYVGMDAHAALNGWRERTLTAFLISTFALVIIYAALYSGYRLLTKQSRLLAENRKLGELTLLDALTGIPNRRLFDTRLQLAWEQRENSTRPLSLLMIDVDHFKKFNDLYGHQQGDDCLAKVAQALKASLHREEDIVARYGGEEFACILNAGETGAVAVARRMRDAVLALDIPHAYSAAGKVTISIGLACGDAGKAVSPGQLIRSADVALYTAKARGRNRLEVFTAGLTAVQA